MAEKGQTLALLDIVESELLSKICKYEVKPANDNPGRTKTISKWPHPHIIKTHPIQKCNFINLMVKTRKRFALRQLVYHLLIQKMLKSPCTI